MGLAIAQGVQIEAADEAATIRMTVNNDGDPISDANRDKIFDAFFTTRRDTGGTGMGLAIAQAVMVTHGGSIGLLHPTGVSPSSCDFPPSRA
jgi:two-component system, OmpR family, sensor histidine kinase CreC